MVLAPVITSQANVTACQATLETDVKKFALKDDGVKNVLKCAHVNMLLPVTLPLDIASAYLAGTEMIVLSLVPMELMDCTVI